MKYEIQKYIMRYTSYFIPHTLYFLIYFPEKCFNIMISRSVNER
jgi:hypothetical protein